MDIAIYVSQKLTVIPLFSQLLIVLSTLWILRRFLYRHDLVFPPGPRGAPIVGNALQIPNDHQWLKFDEWSKIYGDIVRITVMGQPTIILGTFEAASDLLDSRGTIYSDRPPAIMAGELVGWNQGLGYSPGPPNTRFREFRRLFHQFMGPRALADPHASINAAQEGESLRFLKKMLDDPKNFFAHARNSTASLILLVSYGYSASSSSVAATYDPLHLIDIAEDAMSGFARASEPGAFWVDSFPLLKHAPSWVPFKRAARKMRDDLELLYQVPFGFVKQQMKKGIAAPSFVSTYIEEKGGLPTSEEEEFIQAAAASLYSGGAETTPSAITSFILAMVLNPHVQERAQSELDALLGGPTTLRLPTLADRSNLPYINAIVKETWRWNPSVPLGLPHIATQDDVYRGYHIEKGTVVWANIWSILHSPSIYPNPLSFDPERYLNADGSLKQLSKKEDPTEIAFGFGRRICPGQALAENSAFLTLARMLYIFQISPDGDLPKVSFDGFISHPRPFSCRIEPRSEMFARVVERSLTELEE